MSSLPADFGAALRFLRKRAHLTQDELGLAVGYSREQIARLERGSRLPDLAVVAALFVPLLLGKQEQALIEQFLHLAGQRRTDQQITITHTKQTRLEVVSETIETESPPPPRHTPPAALWPLLGRAAELAELAQLLQQKRLITILGAPGIGKTRLALEVAHQVVAHFPAGVAFVSLAGLSSPDDIPLAVLTTLQLTPAPAQTAAQCVLAYLINQTLLLVLDNCEHLLEGVTLFADWLTQAPGLKLLCTSREPLDLYGEQEWPLAPLAVPDLATPPDINQWGNCSAVQLLVARAQAIDPTFQLREENLLPLATLCVALDGLPLALELAAGRLRELPPAEVVQQLLRLRGPGQLSSSWLQQTKRNVAERHRTLQAAIAWSVQRLDPVLQRAFAHLGLFVNGFTAEAAELVAGLNPAGLAQLGRANLVQPQTERFLLLETLRTYATEQLTAQEQLPQAQEKHALFYADLAQQIFQGLRGDEQAQWMSRALADHENCLTALRWALAQQNGAVAVAIAGGLWWFWSRQSWYKLGLQFLEQAVALASPNLLHQAIALNGLASFYLLDEQYHEALACHAQALPLRQQLQDTEGVATVLHNMGLAAYCLGDYAQAAEWLKESIAVYPQDPVSAWCHLGLMAFDQQKFDESAGWLTQAYEWVKESAESWLQAFVLNFLADTLREKGEFAQATELAQKSLAIFEALQDTYYRPDAQLTLAQIYAHQGQYELALPLVAAALEQYTDREDSLLTASCLLVQAEVWWQVGEQTAAFQAWQRSQQLRQLVKRPVSPHEQAQYHKIESLLTHNRPG